jgi:hypothetical protein
MRTVRIRPWPDPVIDTLGHDPRSRYAETFWLPAVGPTCLLLLRRAADCFDEHPDGVAVDTAELSAALGLGFREGAASPLVRALERLVHFDLAVRAGDDLAVRRTLPPVTGRHLRRLPMTLQRRHARWAEETLQGAPLALARRRACRLALELAAVEDDPDTIERALGRVGFHPALCREAAAWAHRRHLDLPDPPEVGVPVGDPAA